MNDESYLSYGTHSSEQDEIIDKILAVLSPTTSKTVATITEEIHIRPNTVARYLKLMKRIKEAPDFEMVVTIWGYQIKLLPKTPKIL